MSYTPYEYATTHVALNEDDDAHSFQIRGSPKVLVGSCFPQPLGKTCLKRAVLSGPGDARHSPKTSGGFKLEIRRQARMGHARRQRSSPSGTLEGSTVPLSDGVQIPAVVISQMSK